MPVNELGGPDVHPPGGLRNDQNRRVKGKLPGNDHLLHIAAGETAHGNIQAGSPDVILPEQPAGVILGGLFPQVEAKTG